MREIGRLRLKFIIYNMLVVTAVIGITFCAVTSVVKHRVNDQGSLALSRVVSGEEQSLIFAAMPPVRMPYFTVLVGEDGVVSLKEGYGAYWEPEFLEQMAVLGMNGEEDMGILDAYHLRYLRISQPAGYMIAFADTTYEDSLRNGIMKYGGMACVAVWLGFFALSYFFSRWAVKPVEESVRMQKQFVADASHELKTPLTVITANAELLQERYAGISAEADKWMEHVNQECREMRALVESLLLLARNDSYVPGKVLEYDIEDDVLMMGNPCRMGQLIKALMDNAVKYCVPRGRAQIRLEKTGRSRARLWVCSQGEPIPEDKRTLIFRRFYRDDSARSSTSGYGLGLAIAAETARSHRARIGVEYKDGMNCFYVTVKRKRG